MREPKKIVKYLPVLGLIIIGISGANLFKTIKINDWQNLAGLAIGVAGLLPAWWGTKITVDSAQDAKDKALHDRIDAIEKLCDDRDRAQGVVITKLAEDIAAIRAQLEIKLVVYKTLLDEISAMRKDLAEHKAHLNFATGFSDIKRQISKVQSDIIKMKSEVGSQKSEAS